MPDLVRVLAERCRVAGGRALLVGGTVRDQLLGRPSRDLDVEVHGIEADDLERLLRRLGRVVAVGRSFGVFKLTAQGETIDVALPRADSHARPTAARRVAGDPDIGIEEAARRRDLTINAIAWDPLTGEWLDPCGGLADISARRLHPADPARFGDDPLRALRVVQLASRLGAHPSTELMSLCRLISLAEQPAERIRGEIFRLLEDGLAPGEGLDLAERIGVLTQVLPEVRPHLGDVSAALDRAARHRPEAGDPPRGLALMLAVLLHRNTPAEIDRVLERLGIVSYLRYPLAAAVRRAAGSWRGLLSPVDDGALMRLAEPDGLGLLALCALSVCNSGTPEHALVREALQRGQSLGIVHRPTPQLVAGRDLQQAGVPPGPLLGELLRRVRTAQLDGELKSPEEAIAYALSLRDDATG